MAYIPPSLFFKTKPFTDGLIDKTQIIVISIVEFITKIMTPTISLILTFVGIKKERLLIAVATFFLKIFYGRIRIFS
jgi:hypothetical protein